MCAAKQGMKSTRASRSPSNTRKQVRLDGLKQSEERCENTMQANPSERSESRYADSEAKPSVKHSAALSIHESELDIQLKDCLNLLPY
jgi:hypothetical protein